MDALLFVRREKWRGRRLVGPLFRSLAVNGGCPVMRGVLWSFWGFVVKFLEGLLHVAQHGDVDIFFGIVTGEGEATVLCSFPFDPAFILAWMASINWSASAFEKYWMPKLSTHPSQTQMLN